MVSINDQMFAEECHPILHLACEAGHTFPNPCDCTRYYMCGNGQILYERCPPGNAYDVTKNRCRLIKDVFVDSHCNYSKHSTPWMRCDKGANMDWLAEKCPAFIPTTQFTTTSTTPSTVTSTAATTTLDVRNNTSAAETTQGMIPAELIIGCLFGGVAVLAIILAIYFLIRRKFFTKKDKDIEEIKTIEYKAVANDGTEVEKIEGKHTPPLSHAKIDDIDTIEKQPLNPEKTADDRGENPVKEIVNEGKNVEQKIRVNIIQ